MSLLDVVLIAVIVVVAVSAVVIEARNRAFGRGFDAGVAEERANRHIPEHEHDYDARSVEHWGVWPTGLDGRGRQWSDATKQWTKVLWACRGCEHRKVVKMEGRWSLEEIGRIRQKQEGFMSPWEGYETK